jgi:hypothetical protein
MRLPKLPRRSRAVVLVLGAVYALANAATVLADGIGGPYPK